MPKAVLYGLLMSNYVHHLCANRVLIVFVEVPVCSRCVGVSLIK